MYEDPASEILPSPVYDVVCTAIYPDFDRELALKMNKVRQFPSPDNLIKFAEKFGVEQEFAWEAINRIERASDLVSEQLNQDTRFKNDPNQTLTKILGVLRP